MHEQRSAPTDGIVIASGYGLKVYVERGHLIVHDGIGRSRRTLRLSRATSGLERLVVIGHSGFVTLEALRWIRDVGASFVQIGVDGEVVAVSSVERFHNTKLRRAQVLAAGTEKGFVVMRSLVAEKIEQQLARVSAMPASWPPQPNGGSGQVDVASVLRARINAIPSCRGWQELRAAEAVAGRWYWQTLASTPVHFDRSWRGDVPEHWRTAGARTSPASGLKSSRKAATPFHALVNYGYAILETEATIALQAYGFDPSLGLMHTDKRYRGSLAHDVMEPVRPTVDGLVVALIGREPFARCDVTETRQGVCRLGPPLARQAARWTPTLRQEVERQAEGLQRALLGTATRRATGPRRNGRATGKGSTRRMAPRQASPR